MVSTYTPVTLIIRALIILIINFVLVLVGYLIICDLLNTSFVFTQFLKILVLVSCIKGVTIKTPIIPDSE